MEALNLFICPNYMRPISIRQPDAPQNSIKPKSGIKGISWSTSYGGWQVYRDQKYLGRAKTINQAKEILRRSEK